MPDRTKLVVIFNHRFEGNLAPLSAIYRDRFEPTYLMPFYRGSDPAVVPVFGSSAFFQGFVREGYRDYREDDATHYAFVGDDVFLNPQLSASTLPSTLGLSPNSGYIKGMVDLAKAPFAWNHMLTAVRAFYRNTGTEHARELPSYDQALGKVTRHTDMGRRIGPRNLLGFSGRPELRRRQLLPAAWFLRHPEARTLPYPLLWTYSDFFVVPAVAMEEFTFLCGVFAAMGVFVEVAIPTALAMACEHIQTEQPSGLVGHELWTAEDQGALVERFGASTRRLTDEFPKNWLYVHPVKLSRWGAA